MNWIAFGVYVTALASASVVWQSSHQSSVWISYPVGWSSLASAAGHAASASPSGGHREPPHAASASWIALSSSSARASPKM